MDWRVQGRGFCTVWSEEHESVRDHPGLHVRHGPDQFTRSMSTHGVDLDDRGAPPWSRLRRNVVKNVTHRARVWSPKNVTLENFLWNACNFGARKKCVAGDKFHVCLQWLVFRVSCLLARKHRPFNKYENETHDRHTSSECILALCVLIEQVSTFENIHPIVVTWRHTFYHTRKSSDHE